MLKNKLSINYKLRAEDLDIFYYVRSNILFLKGNYGTSFLYMPKYFFIKHKYKDLTSSNKVLYFLFLNKYNFFTVIKQIFNLYTILYKFYFFRLKLKGLGFRIRKITKGLFRFFFAYNHFFYFHVPNNIFVKHKKRIILFFSNNKQRLNDIFHHLILIKKMDFYEKTNSFIMPKKIWYLKKPK